MAKKGTRRSRKMGSHNRKAATSHQLTMKQKFQSLNKPIDQVYTDLEEKPLKTLLAKKINVDLPGMGQFYCVACARYFGSNNDLGFHEKTKFHKKRVKQLKNEIPYSHAESMAAIGQGHDDGLGPRDRFPKKIQNFPQQLTTYTPPSPVVEMTIKKPPKVRLGPDPSLNQTSTDVSEMEKKVFEIHAPAPTSDITNMLSEI